MPPRKKKADEQKPAASRKKAKKAVPIQDAPAKDVQTAPCEPEVGVASDLKPAGSSAVEQIVVFHLGEQRYAFPIGSVQEIQQIVAFSEVPAGFEAVIGMVNLRGQVIPALDIRMLVGLAPIEHGVDTPMIICRTLDHLIAVVVDEVEDVITLPDERLAPAPRLHVLADRLVGVCRLDDGLVYLLDVDRVVESVALPEGGSSR